MVEEIWKETKYKKIFVSNYGRVKGKSGKLLKQQISPTGYFVICIKPNGRKEKAKCLKVHRLVARAFLENPNNLPVVNHKDANKLNNNIENLEWCTYKQNAIHAKENGLLKAKAGCYHYLSKLKNDDVVWIRENYIPRDKNFGVRALAKKYGMSHCNISRIVNNVRYKNVPL